MSELAKCDKLKKLYEDQCKKRNMESFQSPSLTISMESQNKKTIEVF